MPGGWALVHGACTKQGHGSVLQWAHHLQEDSKEYDAVWIERQTKAGGLAVQSLAAEASYRDTARHHSDGEGARASVGG